MNKRCVGSMGESAACAALEKSGAVILERNYRRPGGEIDIIAREKKTILFVEVKLRSTLRYGRPAEAVNRTKQLKIIRTALCYLAENNLEDAPIRFDIVEVLPDQLRHIRAAFDATDMPEL